MKTKKTEMQLFLRAMEPEDIDLLYDIENREEAFLIGENRIPFSKEYLRRFIYASLQETFFSSGQLRLIACVRSDTENQRPEKAVPVGVIDFFDYAALHGRAEVGILVCNGCRNRGYGEKILELACAYAKNQLNLHQLYAEVSAENTSSLSLFRKNGFSRCARYKEWLRQGEKRTDVVGWQKILV